MKLLPKSAAPAQAALVALIVAAPLPEAGALPWALTTIECFAFALFALWMIRIACGACARGLPGPARPLLIAPALFAALVLFQMTPLPPAILDALSPAAYRLYTVSLPGWPGQSPDASDSGSPHRAAGLRWRILPTQAEIARGTPLPFAAQRGQGEGAQGQVRSQAASVPMVPRTPRSVAGWRTISLAPSMTAGVLLEFAAYAALFLSVLGYPFGPPGEATVRRLTGAVTSAAVVSGFVVAVLGIVELFTWNGKILWMFVPYDWGSPQPGIALRASGPFVNPDHFGNYLAMVLPLAVAGAVFPSNRVRRARAIRLLSAVSAFMMTGALLLSLSRGAWIAASISLAVLFGLCAHTAKQAEVSRRGILGYPGRRLVAAGLVLVALSLLIIGPVGRQLVDSRLSQTVHSDTALFGRAELAEATLTMARAYPLTGVGLGAWPEAFPRYRRPPWADVMYREAHDDYAQLLAETGMVGFALMAWFALAVGARLIRGLDAVPLALTPTYAALCGALCAMAFHELFDFSLHTPANALLFVVLLAIALRIAEGGDERAGERSYGSRTWRWMAFAGGAGALLLVVMALAEDNVPYPENLRPPATVAQARALIAAHPAESAPHLALIRLAGASLPARERIAEFRAALWLDPTNPYTRDAWAAVLLEQGKSKRALKSITRSVADSPAARTHFYLDRRLVPLLPPAQRAAVERGFQEAVARRYAGAVEGLASFYQMLGRFAAAAGIYRQAATDTHDPQAREHYLVGAGVAYAHAGNPGDARRMLERAIRYAPASNRPYECLVTMVLGPRGELRAARSAVIRGIEEGADAGVLYAALAQAAQSAGDRELERRALEAAVAARPAFGALVRLGLFYIDTGRYGRAALVMRKAAESRPRSAEAYFYLGLAEERGYRFASAERDLGHALRLAPDNPGYRAHYADFERRLGQDLKTVKPPGE